MALAHVLVQVFAGCRRTAVRTVDVAVVAETEIGTVFYNVAIVYSVGGPASRDLCCSPSFTRLPSSVLRMAVVGVDDRVGTHRLRIVLAAPPINHARGVPVLPYELSILILPLLTCQKEQYRYLLTCQ